MTFNKGNIFKTKNVKLNLIRVDSFPLENGHTKNSCERHLALHNLTTSTDEKSQMWRERKEINETGIW